MQREPIILVVSEETDDSFIDILRQRYVEGYRIAVVAPDSEILRQYREAGENVALLIYTQRTSGTEGAIFLNSSSAIFPESRRLLLAESPDPETAMLTVNQDTIDHYLVKPWHPAETKLYPILDELLADWRASVEMPFAYVRGIMTVRAVRIRLDDTLHRAAEVIALSGVGDLMVIDGDNNFVGVLSVGDVLRAALPDVDEVVAEGGTLDLAFRLFLRKGSDLMYKPVEPLVIRNPLVVDPDDHVAKVAVLMIEKNIHRLPVVKDGRLVGTVGRTDVCQAVVGTL